MTTSFALVSLQPVILGGILSGEYQLQAYLLLDLLVGESDEAEPLGLAGAGLGLQQHHQHLTVLHHTQDSSVVLPTVLWKRNYLSDLSALKIPQKATLDSIHTLS
jgi:hypothetical protein